MRVEKKEKREEIVESIQGKYTQDSDRKRRSIGEYCIQISILKKFISQQKKKHTHFPCSLINRAKEQEFKKKTIRAKEMEHQEKHFRKNRIKLGLICSGIVSFSFNFTHTV